MASLVPQKPDLLEAPFANSGDRQLIPRTTTTAGKASLDTGFPEECSLALEQGGIPPSRIDFNGIFNLITAWLHYLQSGGQVSYDQSLNYISPALVYYNGTTYSCLKSNGPQVSGVGIKIPGASGSETYWRIGFGAPTVNQFGNNANSYVTTGVHFVSDAYATSNFPVIGTGGFLTVATSGTHINQAFALRNDATRLFTRVSTDGGTTWSARWAKIVVDSDLRGDAYCQRYITTANPDNSIGKDNDLWIVWR